MSTIEKAVEAHEKRLVKTERSPVQDHAADRDIQTPNSYAVRPDKEIKSRPEMGEADTIAERTPGIIEHSVAVEIPFDKLQELGMITPLSPRSQIAEEFRTIKRPLLMNIAGEGVSTVENANLIMVTSALQGDGKTFCAVNLALSIAMELDKTVLLIDADVSQATAGKLLDLPAGGPGLIDLLEAKGLQVPDVILSTNIHNLRIIPAGNVHERSTELLASQAMTRLMNELSSRYPDRVIVFDSPPLLLTTEAGVLANTMGQVVFVAAAEKTPPAAISEAVSRISRDKVIGMVLNKYKNYHGRYGYGYGYGYGDRYGARRSEAGQ